MTLLSDRGTLVLACIAIFAALLFAGCLGDDGDDGGDDGGGGDGTDGGDGGDGGSGDGGDGPNIPGAVEGELDIILYDHGVMTKLEEEQALKDHLDDTVSRLNMTFRCRCVTEEEDVQFIRDTEFAVEIIYAEPRDVSIGLVVEREGSWPTDEDGNAVLENITKIVFPLEHEDSEAAFGSVLFGSSGDGASYYSNWVIQLESGEQDNSWMDGLMDILEDMDEGGGGTDGVSLEFTAGECDDDIDPYDGSQHGVQSAEWEGDVLTVVVHVSINCAEEIGNGSHSMDGTTIELIYECPRCTVCAECMCGHELIYTFENLEKKDYDYEVVRLE